jgi:predicted kinase
MLRSDVERKALYGIAEHDRLPPEAYEPEVSQRIYGILTDKAARIARAGHSVIVDAVFAKADERAAIETAAAAARADFRGLFLVADLPTRLDRIGARGPDASDANAAVAHQQEEFDTGTIDWTIVDASGAPEATLAEARAAVFV